MCWNCPLTSTSFHVGVTEPATFFAGTNWSSIVWSQRPRFLCSGILFDASPFDDFTNVPSLDFSWIFFRNYKSKMEILLVTSNIKTRMIRRWSYLTLFAFEQLLTHNLCISTGRDIWRFATWNYNQNRQRKRKEHFGLIFIKTQVKSTDFRVGSCRTFLSWFNLFFTISLVISKWNLLVNKSILKNSTSLKFHFHFPSSET